MPREPEPAQTPAADARARLADDLLYVEEARRAAAEPPPPDPPRRKIGFAQDRR